MKPGIAIVGMACIYPDAHSPAALWENALAQRRAFRRIPRERLRLEDYYSDDKTLPDTIYSTEAALITDFEFDRRQFRVVGSTFRSADTAHWLALSVADAALRDAGFENAEGLPLEETAVIVGNTLTGEFSRANTLRLRWPYVRRVVHAELLKKGWSADDCHAFLARLEEEYKSPFPVPGEETLAGGLSNTIAGRICNHFDFKGGGYTVDGACAASLLAVINACNTLTTGDAAVALAGGVDLSLDPFELVGFARTGALAPQLMRVYDARSAGFWPGEGCGFIVLMREDEAIRRGRPIYGVIRGWGVSSDGSGGITRPEVAGQKLALERAYRKAGFGPDRVGYFEGHGTGTAVGDATELRVISEARRAANANAPRAVISSIKANIGHTKAAAGIAGFIKAAMAVREAILPPATGCDTPHSSLTDPNAALRILRSPEPWTDPEKGDAPDAPRRAAVSAMGFGGINSHVVIESSPTAKPARARTKERAVTTDAVDSTLTYRAQDAELFVFAAQTREQLIESIDAIAPRAAELSRAELTDLAASLSRDLKPGPFRAAIVAASPAQLAERIDLLESSLTSRNDAESETPKGCFSGRAESAPRIGFLFPGQGSPAHLTGGALRRRFAEVDRIYNLAALPTDSDGVSTDVAQPAIAAASAAAARILTELGVIADVAVGHSLGELAALHWAGAMDVLSLIATARARGRAMADLGSPTGAMAGVRTDEKGTRALLATLEEGAVDPCGIVIAGLNSPRQTVVSGSAADIDRLIGLCQTRGITATRIPVSHAFHSELVAAAMPALREHLKITALSPLKRRVVSTITGKPLAVEENLCELLAAQVTSPVRFIEAAQTAFADCDLLIEVGPGEVLSGLAREILPVAIVSTDAGCETIAPLLGAVAAAFVRGANPTFERLYSDRLVRPIQLDRRPTFFVNPCELAPTPDADDPDWIKKQLEFKPSDDASKRGALSPTPTASTADLTPIERIRRLVAEKTELPLESVGDDDRFLNDLHLNSISVGQIVADAARQMSLPPPVSPTAFANATVAELAAALRTWVEESERGAPRETARPRHVAGIESWIYPMEVSLVERPLAKAAHHGLPGGWQVIAAPDHPLNARIKSAFAGKVDGGGIVVCLPAALDESAKPLLLDVARRAVPGSDGHRLVIVQQSGGSQGFAKTLHLERPDIDVAVVQVPFDAPKAAEWVAAEASSLSGYVEAHYDADGTRRVPRLAPIWLDGKSGTLKIDSPERNGHSKPSKIPLTLDDVVLISGGGKGIAAECAVFLARKTGAKIALLGRSAPESDAELTQTMGRLKAAGVTHCYQQADVSDSAAIRSAISKIITSLGPITAVIHAAGLNEPRLLDQLDDSAFIRTLRPKVEGIRNILDAVDEDRLRLLVSFGSIIAQAGMPGQAEYALANDWLAGLTADWGRAHAHCRCLTLDWSVWQDVGMGRRLGRIEALTQQGVTPIPTDEGLHWLEKILASDTGNRRIIIAGRFGAPATLGARTDAPPLLRFVERIRIDVPGVEFVVDASLSTDTDPYVNDHALRGERIFPAVMGLEALTQALQAFTSRDANCRIESFELLRPVVVPERGSVVIRMALLARGPDRIDAVLRSSVTEFQSDHFRLTFRLSDGPQAAVALPTPEINGHGLLPIDRDHDLYADRLFHRGRFKRLAGYHRLLARECHAKITPAERTTWFAPYQPADLILGDPAARDAAIHAIQSCIPHERLLPVRVERIVRHAHAGNAATAVRAIETGHADGSFTYDMQMIGEQGEILETWNGLQLRVLETIACDDDWSPALLGNYIERRAGELLCSTTLSVVLEHTRADGGRADSTHALGIVSGAQTAVTRRPDGKPESANGRNLSASHAADLVLALAASGRAGCDVEPVAVRETESWRSLLGADALALAKLIATENHEEIDAAATRVWAAKESMKKAGLPTASPLTLDAVHADGWIVLRSGDTRCATFVTSVRDKAQPHAFAVLAGGDR